MLALAFRVFAAPLELPFGRPRGLAAPAEAVDAAPEVFFAAPEVRVAALAGFAGLADLAGAADDFGGFDFRAEDFGLAAVFAELRAAFLGASLPPAAVPPDAIMRLTASVAAVTIAAPILLALSAAASAPSIASRPARFAL